MPGQRRQAGASGRPWFGPCDQRDPRPRGQERYVTDCDWDLRFAPLFALTGKNLENAVTNGYAVTSPGAQRARGRRSQTVTGNRSPPKLTGRMKGW